MFVKQKMLHAVYFTPASDGSWRGIPLCLWGKPGVAKSSIARLFARYVRGACEVAAVGARGEGFFGCTPVKSGTDENPRIVYPCPQWTDKFDPLGSIAAKMQTIGGLVLADEATTAKGEIKAALLTLVLDGEISGHTLAPQVRVWMAANPTDCSADGEDLSAPNANRMCHVEWALSVEDLCAFFIFGDQQIETIDPVAEETRVLAAWPKARANAARQVAAFLRRRPDLAHKMPEMGSAALGRAWPSPRTWEMTIRVIATSVIHNLSDEDRDTLGAGCVGEGAWGELLTYLATLDLPDPAALLDGHTQWAPDTRRIDIAAVTLDACVALVCPKPTSPELCAQREARAKGLWTLLDKAAQLGMRDLTQSAQTALIKAGLMTCAGGLATKLLAESHVSGLQAAIGATR